MASRELAEHAGYLRDTHRLAAFQAALSGALAGRELSVLDLGSGTGILGLMAAAAGARIVYSVESGAIVGTAAEVARRNELADRIEHMHGISTEIELPERVDVAVCDQIGGFVHDGGILRHFSDVRRRLLAPDGVLIPERFRLFLAPATCDPVRRQIDLWRSRPEGFDLSSFSQHAVNAEHYVFPEEVEPIASGVEVADVSSDHVDPITGGGTARIDRDGELDGLLGWFEADLGAGSSLTNRPGAADRMDRWCTFYPLDHRCETSRGDTVRFSIDVRPILNAVSWNVTVERHDGVRTERHSTLLGAFIAQNELERAHGVPIVLTRVGKAVRDMLGLVDGSRPEAAIIAATRPGELGGPSVEKTLRETLRRFSSTPGSDGRDGQSRT
ncbi:MAG TPA: class I SAM-dependent methyltransferase [Gaiellaceae bacterium]|nr:class I SAM-dependent methyltransferase [Gaiellaceae bacterium]